MNRKYTQLIILNSFIIHQFMSEKIFISPSYLRLFETILNMASNLNIFHPFLSSLIAVRFTLGPVSDNQRFCHFYILARMFFCRLLANKYVYQESQVTQIYTHSCNDKNNASHMVIARNIQVGTQWLHWL